MTAPAITGLLAIRFTAEDTAKRGLRGARAGIVFHYPPADPRPRFLDLDTLSAERLQADEIAGGRLYDLDRHMALRLARGIDLSRRRLRGQHVVFAGALSEIVGQALRAAAARLPAGRQPLPAVTPPASAARATAARA